MKHSEFRLGNYVRNKEGKLCRISQLDGLQEEVGITFHCDPPGLHSDTVTPVKLTSKILDAIGFKETYVEAVQRSLLIRDEIYLTSDFRLCAVNGGLSIISNPKRYIHEIQNLYFELTGIELEMNDDFID